MRRSLALLLLGFAACKPSGPPPAELAAQREVELKKLCADPGPRARWEQLAALAKQVKEAPPVKAAAVPAAPLKFRELHLSDDVPASTDVNWVYDFEGQRRGIIGSCVLRQEQCRSDDTGLEAALRGCATIDAYVVIRPLEERRPRVPEGGGTKYEGGTLSAEAFAFSLAGGDGGAPVQLGAFTFHTKLRGEVEVFRDSPTEDIERALNEGLRKSALRHLEAMTAR